MRATFILIVALLVTSVASANKKTDVAQLHKARVDAAAKVFAVVEARYSSGAATLEAVYDWSVRWFESERDGGGAAKGADAHLKRMEALAVKVGTMVDSGSAPASDKDAAAYFVAEAKVWVATSKK